MSDLSFIHRYAPSSIPDAPTLLVLHSTGGNEDELLPFAREMAPGAGLLSPRGKVLEQGMPRFFRRLAEGVFDIDDLKRRTEELATFVDAAVSHYGFSRERIVAVGFSNGANIAASLLLMRPSLLRGAVLMRAMVPFVPDKPPALAGRSVLMLSGRTDRLVAPAETERLAALLRDAGADLTLEWQPGGHALTEDDVAIAQRWLLDRT